MAHEALPLTAFAPGVASNTLDFALADVTHAGKPMRGVIARRDIGAIECPLFVGAYPGRLISTPEAAMKRRAFALRHGVDRAEQTQIATAYNLCADEIEFGCELDPSDAEGCLLPEFAGHLACRINEPPQGRARNATFVFNAPRSRYEVWLTAPLACGEEVYLCYGRKFHRDYAIDPDACKGSRLRRIEHGARLVIDTRI